MSISFTALLEKTSGEEVPCAFHAYLNEDKKKWVISTTIDYISYIKNDVIFHPLVNTKQSVQKLVLDSNNIKCFIEPQQIKLFILFYDEVIEIYLDKIDIDHQQQNLFNRIQTLEKENASLKQQVQIVNEKQDIIENELEITKKEFTQLGEKFNYLFLFSPFVKSPKFKETLELTLRCDIENVKLSFSPPTNTFLMLPNKINPKNVILVKPVTFEVAFNKNIQCQQLVNNHTLILQNNMQINYKDNLNIDSFFSKGNKNLSLHVLLNTIQLLYGLEFVSASPEEIIQYVSKDVFSWSMYVTLKNTGKYKKFDFYTVGDEVVDSVNFYNFISNTRYNVSDKGITTSTKTMSYLVEKLDYNF